MKKGDSGSMNGKPARLNFFRKFEQATAVIAVRRGLINIIPVLIIGAFALILKTFPVEAYQNTINGFSDGLIPELLDIVYSATFGVLSLFMTFSISRSYMKMKAEPDTVRGGAVIVSLVSFFILSGAYLPDFSLANMGPKSMFLAIISALGSSSLYLYIRRSFRERNRTFFSAGADREFNRMLSTLLPISIVALAVAVINIAIVRVFEVGSFRDLIIELFNKLFSYGEVGFFKGLFFVLLSSVLWFFGIHGSDILEEVMQTYFAPGLAMNQAAAAAGTAPTAVLTKEFFDCFVLMGGCGSAICLLVALLLFSRNRASRKLSLTAAFPMIFNINELMVFGLPIIFNPAMLIPFLAVPLVCYSSAYLAISTGLVPMITGEVAWTTPVILGGLRATGSAAGSLLQVFNLVVGVLIYLPFVKLYDRRIREESKRNYDDFMEYFRKNEDSFQSIRITDLTTFNGEFAKSLCIDLQHDFDRGNIRMAYQPLYNYDGQCIGVEALLRWVHPVYGSLYPPLVIKLAEEGGFLTSLEEAVIQKVVADRDEIIRRFGEGIEVSFNITSKTFASPEFIAFMRKFNAEHPFRDKFMCVEITEQTALSFDEHTQAVFRELHDMGLILAIDDFSMGQTSIHYLKDNLFDVIKLDGSLVKGLFTYKNCKEIISSIVGLAQTLNLTVIAEFVETEEQRDALHEIGCSCYQGYLYSPAVYLESQLPGQRGGKKA